MASADGRLEIQAGGGVTVEAIPRARARGVDAIHLSARRRVVATRVGPGGGEAAHDVADGEVVAAAVAAAREAGGRVRRGALLDGEGTDPRDTVG